jgi:NAD(P)-dependent dehydrogenase (short-subunit alcohol dehydrogenase family)
LTGRLEGRGAVVTGVGSGLGREIARVLAGEGARVLGCDINDGPGAETMDGIGFYRHADVSRERDIEGLVDKARDHDVLWHSPRVTPHVRRWARTSATTGLRFGAAGRALERSSEVSSTGQARGPRPTPDA